MLMNVQYMYVCIYNYIYILFKSIVCIFIATGCRENFQISKMMQTCIFHLLLVLSTCRQLMSAEIIEDDDRECTVSDAGIV